MYIYKFHLLSGQRSCELNECYTRWCFEYGAPRNRFRFHNLFNLLLFNLGCGT